MGTDVSSKDFALLLIAKVARMFSLGAFLVIFYDLMAFKDIRVVPASWLQAPILLGNILLSLLLSSLKLTPARRLMTASLLQLLSAFVYSQTDNIFPLFLAGLLGVLPVTGGELLAFEEAEASIYKHMEGGESTLKWYSLTGWVFQALGAGLGGFFMQNQLDEAEGTLTVVKGCAAMAGLSLLCYSLMNSQKEREERELSLADMDNEDALRLSVYGFFMLVLGVSDSFCTLSYLSAFF